MGQNQAIVAAGAGTEQPFMPGELLAWKVTGGDLDLAEMSLAPGVKVPEHIHHRHNEAFYVLAGTLRFKVGSDLAEGGAGTVVFVPQGTRHMWANTGTEPVRVLVIFTPGGMAGFFADMAPLIPALAAAMGEMSSIEPTLLAQATAIGQRYGYQVVGPPLL